MCIANSCSPSASIGEISAASGAASPARKHEQPPAGAARGAASRAHRPPAPDVERAEHEHQRGSGRARSVHEASAAAAS